LGGTSAWTAEQVTATCRFYHGDCREVLRAIAESHPDGLFDMIFADGPYFLSNGGITCHAGKIAPVDKGNWDASQGFAADHEFHLSWLTLCQRVLRPNGTIWVTGTSHSIFSLGYAMQKLGFKILNDITWQKPNPPPNACRRYFTHATETLIWAAKTKKSKHVFDYEAMKGAAGGKQMKSVWTMVAAGRAEKKLGKHPTQKPVALVERCILASTKPGDRVMDCFMGSATTALACLKNNRLFEGIELDPDHLELARKRLQAATAGQPKPN
jgi:site-specific DNA-methyltransferase (adenine-specific)